MNYLINALGISDSGGITVLDNLLSEICNTNLTFIILCNENENIGKLISEYENCINFEFMLVKNINFLKRLYYENIVFNKIIKDRNIFLVYNFSGSAQFGISVPQITKIHNLLFYSKKIDKVYFEKKEYLKWFKQIFLKRLVFHTMIKQVKYIEVQSSHVQDYISDFIDISKQSFFIKSDIDFTRDNFSVIKEYDFNKKIRILFIVGPHFEYLHKNFADFVKTMILLREENVNFEINITLTKEQLNKSVVWNKDLNENTKFLGYLSKDKIKEQFLNNTILVSTSVIETLGLHVIEAIQNGILSVVPNEIYSKKVYGEDILTYELFNILSMRNQIKKISLLGNNEIKDIISKNQDFLLDNEGKKYKNILQIFDKVIKESNVQK